MAIPARAYKRKGPRKERVPRVDRNLAALAAAPSQPLDPITYRARKVICSACGRTTVAVLRVSKRSIACSSRGHRSTEKHAKPTQSTIRRALAKLQFGGADA